MGSLARRSPATDKIWGVLPFLRVLAVENALDYDSIANDPTWSVIKNAVKSGKDTVDALKLLRACGVNITRVLADGRTVLHLAAHHCQEDDALSYLLETGCAKDIDRQDQWGWTPLHYAVLARLSFCWMFLMLLELKLDPLHTLTPSMTLKNIVMEVFKV
ncbi:hypothetical protein HBI20_070000 [Parastagonospora nodorum]|nr:hypothetical protein HBI45_107290 [Parastagonospora nodorum]KAH5726049.1 hypothetical protein HBI20_070000 [Parastagonospora nodorum]